MIRRLYREYKLQIIFAFLLVILENFAYVAEPYVFGKAIDGLREAHRLEEEVDSSLSTIQARQIADSVRTHILDSLRIVDSMRNIEEYPLPSNMPSEETPLPIQPSSYRWSPQRNAPEFYFAVYHAKRAQQHDTIALPPEGTEERAAIDSVRKALAKHDSMRSRHRRADNKTREAARDSIRHALERTPPSPGKPAGTQPPKTSERSFAFYVTREVGPFLPPLIPWVLLFLINSGLGAFRRVYDTRIYTKMFAKLSSDVVARQLAQGEDLSKVAARSSMAWHNIEFFQYNVPEFLEQLVAVAGAVIALGIFDWRLTVVGGILILLVLLGSKFYMSLLLKIQVKLHDRYEDEYNTFSTRDPGKIRAYYNDIADLEITYSERSTISYGVIRIALLFMFLSTLYISIDLDRFTIGSLYSIIAYVWSFVTATEYIPYLSEKWVALKDASRRITATLPAEG